MITKKKDPKFGEIVVLLTEGDTKQAKTELSGMTNKFSKPKLIIHIDKLPLTETGKPARAKAMELASRSSDSC
jgi:O-succinylbenzoic acid--CoA ligase